ncbi:copper chaperone PCu(A)C [Pleionea sp. CnH1-48]|uniref:copper chaperone PCu(A)C n=1 Tax=Pleionea sp. CnH1-48 TaxID=2954494 RepID=UPI002096B846|nr:copper chaperone PCu(A)C [Pleionea sp. CnH1-48]MCO7226435.1 copper chaperone PCu(A)C [Pleionea sp. CnH1-48]
MRLFKQTIAVCVIMLSLWSVEGHSHSLKVTDSWARAVVEGQRVSAVYLTLENASDKMIEVVDVESDVSRSAMFHLTQEQDGVARMLHQSSIQVPGENRVEFKPGGLHIMLMGIKKPLSEGQTIELDLVLKNGEVIKAKVPVKK